MTNYPEIYESKWGDEQSEKFCASDAAINSGIIGGILDLVRPYAIEDVCSGDGSPSGLDPFDWISPYPWRVRIEDQHLREEEPHYILDIGDCKGDRDLARRVDAASAGGFAEYPRIGHIVTELVIPYCDNHSRFDTPRYEDEPIEREIVQDPGRFTIWVTDTVRYPQKGTIRDDVKAAAILIARLYISTMHAALPDYHIATPPGMLDTEGLTPWRPFLGKVL